VALEPMLRLVEAHVLAAERLHGDDTTVPVLAKGKTDTGRCWVYVRDDTPFGGTAPPAAIFYYSRDRKGEHPQRHLASYAGLFQADAFDGYRQLYLSDRSPGPIVEAGCWVHARRPFFAMADLEENARRQAAGKRAIILSPIAIEVVRRIDALFDIERTINGKPAEERRTVRQELSRPLVEALEVYMGEQRAKLSRGHDLAKSIISSSVGRRSPCSLTMGVCVYRTMPLNELCAASLWAENRGCSADPIAAAIVLPPCTASSSPQR